MVSVSPKAQSTVTRLSALHGLLFVLRDSVQPGEVMGTHLELAGGVTWAVCHGAGSA